MVTDQSHQYIQFAIGDVDRLLVAMDYNGNSVCSGTELDNWSCVQCTEIKRVSLKTVYLAVDVLSLAIFNGKLLMDLTQS